MAIFLEHLKQYEGFPSRIHTDCGSENVVLADIQSYLRRNHTDKHAGLKSHMFGTSLGTKEMKVGGLNIDIIEAPIFLIFSRIYSTIVFTILQARCIYILQDTFFLQLSKKI